MQVRDMFINGIGVYIPEIQDIGIAVEQGKLTADTVADMGFTGVAVAGDLPAPEMALRAARDAVKDSGVSPHEFALLLYADVWHQGPTSWQPQLYLQHHLVGDDPLSVEIKHGCVGMLSGMELATGYLRAAPEYRAALVVASDNFGTPLMNRWTSGAGFTVLGDCASAVVLTKEPGWAQVLSISSTCYSKMEEQWHGGEPMFPPGVTIGRGVDLMAGRNAFEQKVSASTAGAIALSHLQRIIGCTTRALHEAGVKTSDIKRVIAPNMPRPEAQSYLSMLGFSIDRSTWEFGSGLGHLGASDHIVSLHHLISTGQVGVGDHILLCGLAPGVTYKSAVMKIVATP
jgi:3-oxoacyl-[acyl-carrier-protein] synthase-3/clorobiocin biosynthesis protein CloN2